MILAMSLTFVIEQNYKCCSEIKAAKLFNCAKPRWLR